MLLPLLERLEEAGVAPRLGCAIVGNRRAATGAERGLLIQRGLDLLLNQGVNLPAKVLLNLLPLQILLGCALDGICEFCHLRQYCVNL